MYTEYFGLKENPFSIAPDPAYFYVSEKHREALAHLMYAFNSEGGFVLLTGEVGTGKTTVCRRLLEQAPDNYDIAFILYPKLTGEELLAAICDEFVIGNPGDTAGSRVLVARIYDYLVRTHGQGRRAALILEEAQNLSDDVLEQVRLLTNLETNKRKLLQIIMLGQPELLQRLRQPELRQLSQRITARYHLAPLSREEMAGYISHRLAVAGLSRSRLFPPSVVKGLFGLTGGVPRLINVMCDRALTGTYVEAKDRVDKKTLRIAAREVSGRGYARRFPWRVPSILLVSLVILCMVIAAIYYGRILIPAPTGVLARSTDREREISRERPKNADEPAGMDTAQKAPLDTLDLSGDRVGLFTRERALHALLSKWRIDLKAQPVSQVCTRIGAHGFACLEGKESLEGLRQMNRPAVLLLNDERFGDYYATLTALTRQTATVAAGDETKVVDIKELGRRWSGGYMLFWRLPPGYREGVTLGDQGPYVSWIAKQLALAEGRAINPDSKQTFSDGMAKQVRQFQIAEGLVPDGRVGPKTLIRLSDLGGRNLPNLNAGRGGR
jgi:general secretion pathway protein A